MQHSLYILNIIIYITCNPVIFSGLLGNIKRNLKLYILGTTRQGSHGGEMEGVAASCQLPLLPKPLPRPAPAPLLPRTRVNLPSRYQAFSFSPNVQELELLLSLKKIYKGINNVTAEFDVPIFRILKN